MNINDLHQLPENHPISKRAKISLAHIDVRGDLRRNRENMAKRMAEGAAQSAVAAANMSVGQIVRTKRGDQGAIVDVTGGVISVEIGGAVRKFVASTLVLV